MRSWRIIVAPVSRDENLSDEMDKAEELPGPVFGDKNCGQIFVAH